MILSKRHKVRKFLATGGGLGYTPKLPGTAGTLGGVLIYLFLIWTGRCSVWELVLACGIVTVLGLWLASWAETHFQTKDPGQFVLDEIAGFLVALVAVDLGGGFSVYEIVIVGFVAFRLFDITKPFPIRWIEHWPGRWGIVMDDVMAGIYANLSIRVFFKLMESST